MNLLDGITKWDDGMIVSPPLVTRIGRRRIPAHKPRRIPSDFHHLREDTFRRWTHPRRSIERPSRRNGEWNPFTVSTGCVWEEDRRSETRHRISEIIRGVHERHGCCAGVGRLALVARLMTQPTTTTSLIRSMIVVLRRCEDLRTTGTTTPVTRRVGRCGRGVLMSIAATGCAWIWRQTTHLRRITVRPHQHASPHASR